MTRREIARLTRQAASIAALAQTAAQAGQYRTAMILGRRALALRIKAGLEQ